MARSPQIQLLKDEPKAYGGELRKRRKGRIGARPLSTKHSMHLVLRSSKAKRDWSFRKGQNPARIENIVGKFSRKYGVQVLSGANVGNHLHFHIRLRNRYGYMSFIRAVTAAITMAVTGVSRHSRPAPSHERNRFWDYRPFTRVVVGFRALLRVKDYVRINQLEGQGVDRVDARYIVLFTDRGKSDRIA